MCGSVVLRVVSSFLCPRSLYWGRLYFLTSRRAVANNSSSSLDGEPPFARPTEVENGAVSVGDGGQDREVELGPVALDEVEESYPRLM